MFKIIAFVLLMAFAGREFACAAAGSFLCSFEKCDMNLSMLSPEVQIGRYLFKKIFLDAKADFAGISTEATAVNNIGELELSGKLRNLEQLKDIVKSSDGVSGVISVCAEGEEGFIQEQLSRAAPYIFRRDNKVRLLTHTVPVNVNRGQFLAILDAYEHWKKEAKEAKDELYKNDVLLGVLMLGNGSRVSPFTQRMYGIKAFLPSIFQPEGYNGYLHSGTASLYSWNLVAYHLKRMGFRGIAWKWSDEPQISANDMNKLGFDLSQTDIVRFGSEVFVTEELAKTKEWLWRIRETGDLMMQIHRRPYKELLNRFGIKDRGQKVKAFVHNGSPAFSYLFLEEAQKIFGKFTDRAIDVDGYLVEALTLDEATWKMELSRDAGLRKFVQEIPDFYELCRQLKLNIESIRRCKLDIKVIDFGKKRYCADYGNLFGSRISFQELRLNAEEGRVARVLANIDNIASDPYGNIIYGDSLVPGDGSVCNSVVINTKIYGTDNNINGAVLINSECANSQIAEGSVVWGSTLIAAIIGERSFSFMSVREALNIPSDTGHTSIPVLSLTGDAVKGLENWRSDIIPGGIEKESYTEARFGNPGSFWELSERMKNREIQVEMIEKEIDEKFRAPLRRKMKAIEQVQLFRETGEALHMDTQVWNFVEQAV
ncbi:MAG: hypothetical protein KJ893_08960 [Candidatus Omnitrophica bacterium]|nr:hypothetical protein [Candidatus Omnitrophota bacterium]